MEITVDNFQEFTSYEYLLIDIANNHHSDLDKKTFNERIDWVNNNLGQLEAEAEGHSWKARPLYLKACQTLRKAQQGKPTGHLVGFDAICSGMQIMSALTGCESGAKATGLIDTGKRPDAYTECTTLMINILGHHIPGERKRVKEAVNA
jgi:DNA-directed RNA polymerase